MGGINVGRWLAGGVAAGVVIWILEGAASVLYMNDMKAALERHGLTLEVTGQMMAMSVLISLLVGLVLIFFYAAARPRFGAGPKTAAVVAVALWAGGYLVTLLGYQVLGLFPVGMLALWGAVGLIEMILAAMLGGWIYREA